LCPEILSIQPDPLRSAILRIACQSLGTLDVRLRGAIHERREDRLARLIGRFDEARMGVEPLLDEF